MSNYCTDNNEVHNYNDNRINKNLVQFNNEGVNVKMYKSE